MNHLKLDAGLLIKPHPDITVKVKTENEFHLSVHNSAGNGTFSQYIFHDAVFSIAKNLNQEDFLIEEHPEKPVIWFHFNPVGAIFHHLDMKLRVVTQASSSNILFFRRPVEYEIHKNIPNTSLVIMISPDYFMKLLEESKILTCSQFEKKIYSIHNDNILINESTITPAIQIVLHEILNEPFHSSIKRLYLEGKVHELMALKLNQLIATQDYNPVKTQSIVLRSDDIEKIKSAGEIIEKHIADPPTISQLARQIGINEFKLKNGFKLIFGKTIFGYLRELRLEKAMLLIEQREMNIAEISFEVGYRNPAHFADAFRCCYGINPGRLLAEKRKSYSI